MKLTERAGDRARAAGVNPVRWLDRAFFLFGTIAAAWLAFILIHKLVTAGWRDLWYFIPFWLVVTYLLLPRIHTVLSRVYLPDYFIGRTRTREGVLGDPVNVALRGTALQIHTAMVRAGWHLADELDIRSGWRIVTHTLRGKSYPDAPVSSLYLFGRRHAFTYQQEVEGSPEKRHHVRFWPTPTGWLLPGGTDVDWLAAGTYDRSVGLSWFTFQVTHRIAADVDTERDHIVETLKEANPSIRVETLRNFSTGYHHRNGGGDRIETDGDLPIVNLYHVMPELEILDRIPSSEPPAPTGERVPLTVGFGVLLMVLRVVLGIISLSSLMTFGATALISSPLVQGPFHALGLTSEEFRIGIGIVIGLFLAVYLVLGYFVYRGNATARTITLFLSTASVAMWIVFWMAGSAQRTLALNLWGAAVEILVLLALSSDTARLFVGNRLASTGPVHVDEDLEGSEPVTLEEILLENGEYASGHDGDRAEGEQ